ncbi:hypothetical protein ACLIA0_00875 [Bacillaceae bacterium W0354]
MQDLLLALSCLLVISSFFIPFLSHIATHYKNTELNFLAEEILDDELINISTQESFPPFLTAERNQYAFNLTFQLDGFHLLGCINWKNAQSKPERMCRYVPNFKKE